MERTFFWLRPLWKARIVTHCDGGIGDKDLKTVTWPARCGTVAGTRMKTRTKTRTRTRTRARTNDRTTTDENHILDEDEDEDEDNRDDDGPKKKHL